MLKIKATMQRNRGVSDFSRNPSTSSAVHVIHLFLKHIGVVLRNSFDQDDTDTLGFERGFAVTRSPPNSKKDCVVLSLRPVGLKLKSMMWSEH